MNNKQLGYLTLMNIAVRMGAATSDDLPISHATNEAHDRLEQEEVYQVHRLFSLLHGLEYGIRRIFQ